MSTPSIPARPVDIAEESVAGEEDPGASLDIPPRGAAAAIQLNKDNDFCRACGGSGMLNGGPCPDCEGSGKVDAWHP